MLHRNHFFKLKPLLLRRGGRQSRSERLILFANSNKNIILFILKQPLSQLKLTDLLRRRALYSIFFTKQADIKDDFRGHNFDSDKIFTIFHLLICTSIQNAKKCIDLEFTQSDIILSQ